MRERTKGAILSALLRAMMAMLELLHSSFSHLQTISSVKIETKKKCLEDLDARIEGQNDWSELHRPCNPCCTTDNEGQLCLGRV